MLGLFLQYRISIEKQPHLCPFCIIRQIYHIWAFVLHWCVDTRSQLVDCDENIILVWEKSKALFFLSTLEFFFLKLEYSFWISLVSSLTIIIHFTCTPNVWQRRWRLTARLSSKGWRMLHFWLNCNSSRTHTYTHTHTHWSFWSCVKDKHLQMHLCWSRYVVEFPGPLKCLIIFVRTRPWWLECHTATVSLIFLFRHVKLT